jgi:hypothetical protein
MTHQKQNYVILQGDRKVAHIKLKVVINCIEVNIIIFWSPLHSWEATDVLECTLFLVVTQCRSPPTFRPRIPLAYRWFFPWAAEAKCTQTDFYRTIRRHTSATAVRISNTGHNNFVRFYDNLHFSLSEAWDQCNALLPWKWTQHIPPNVRNYTASYLGGP